MLEAPQEALTQQINRLPPHVSQGAELLPLGMHSGRQLACLAKFTDQLPVRVYPNTPPPIRSSHQYTMEKPLASPSSMISLFDPEIILQDNFVQTKATHRPTRIHYTFMAQGSAVTDMILL